MRVSIETDLAGEARATRPASNLADVWYRSTQLEVMAGRACTVETRDGREILDFSAGIGALSTGHCHPRVVSAIAEQAAQFVHAQVNTYRHPLLEPLASELAEVTPAGIDRFFFSNSGAEAIEGAVKLARQATGRPNVVVLEHGFHGRTSLCMAMTTTNVVTRARNGPLPAGIHVAPYPAWHRSGETPQQASDRCIASFHELLRRQTAPDETAAVVVETVIGEGGYLVPPGGFLEGLAAICADHGILLVLDEVQCGFGRTGRWFACEHFGLEPDIIVMAKGLASGFPISAVGARSELTARWRQGSHGGTYGGNPLGCAAALATIAVLREERLVENAAERGEHLRRGLDALALEHAGVGDVRGLGLMQAFEVVRDDGKPDGERARAVVRHCLDRADVLLLTCGEEGAAIRFVPPLIVTAPEVDRALEACRAALAAGTPG